MKLVPCGGRRSELAKNNFQQVFFLTFKVDPQDFIEFCCCLFVCCSQ